MQRRRRGCDVFVLFAAALPWRELRDLAVLCLPASRLLTRAPMSCLGGQIARRIWQLCWAAASRTCTTTIPQGDLMGMTG